MTTNQPHTPKKTIRQLRQEWGWSQQVLAGRLRVKPSTISNWERGYRVPSHGHLQALANLFGVSVAAIAVGPVEQPP